MAKKTKIVRQNNVIGIFGDAHTGKTSLIKKFASSWRKHNKGNVIYFSREIMMDEYRPSLGFDHLIMKIDRISALDKIKDSLIIIDDIEYLLEYILKQPDGLIPLYDIFLNAKHNNNDIVFSSNLGHRHYQNNISIRRAVINILTYVRYINIFRNRCKLFNPLDLTYADSMNEVNRYTDLYGIWPSKGVNPHIFIDVEWKDVKKIGMDKKIPYDLRRISDPLNPQHTK